MGIELKLTKHESVYLHHWAPAASIINEMIKLKLVQAELSINLQMLQRFYTNLLSVLTTNNFWSWWCSGYIIN